jgi:hypothetical protein
MFYLLARRGTIGGIAKAYKIGVTFMMNWDILEVIVHIRPQSRANNNMLL